ncbi:MAG: oligosaccharide flippase family protein [candidate division WOR-3 bacterium]
MNGFAYDRHRVLAWFQDDIFQRLLKNAGWVFSSNGITTLLGLVGAVFKARALGPEQFGLLAVIMAYSQVIGRFFTLQPWQALIKYGAKSLQQERNTEFMGYVKLTFILDLVSCFLSTIVAIGGAYLYGGWQNWDKNSIEMTIVFSLGLFFGLSSAPIGVLRLLERFHLLSMNQVLGAVIQFLGVVFVYLLGGGIWGFLIVILISGILRNMHLLFLTYQELKKAGLYDYRRAAIVNYRQFVRFSWWTYLTSSISIPIKQLDMIIVSAVISLEAAGIYKIIKQFLQLFNMLVDPIYQAVYPQFALNIADGKEKKALKYAGKIALLTLVVLGPLMLLLTGSSYFWLPGVFGKDYASGWLPLVVFAIFAFLAFAASSIHPLFLAMGFVKQNTVIALVSNAVYLLLALLLGKKYGLIGLAIAYGWDIIFVGAIKFMYIVNSVGALKKKRSG